MGSWGGPLRWPVSSIPQGDIGEKGPEGAPGKDGGRVSECRLQALWGLGWGPMGGPVGLQPCALGREGQCVSVALVLSLLFRLSDLRDFPVRTGGPRVRGSSGAHGRVPGAKAHRVRGPQTPSQLSLPPSPPPSPSSGSDWAHWSSWPSRCQWREGKSWLPFLSASPPPPSLLLTS